MARHSDDAIVVLLPNTEAANATELAEHVVRTVESRLRTVDHRNDTPVPVTLSAAVVNVSVAVGDVIDPERYLADAEAAVARAKLQGRNRVVRMDGLSQAAHTRASACERLESGGLSAEDNHVAWGARHRSPARGRGTDRWRQATNLRGQ